jgi:hypothetical protein
MYSDGVRGQRRKGGWMKTCIVKGCRNTTDGGNFVGDLCVPCYEYIVHGEGIYSQAYRNACAQKLKPVKITMSLVPNTAILKERIQRYIDLCYAGELRDNSDWKESIFESALEAYYGKGVWEWLNAIQK